MGKRIAIIGGGNLGSAIAEGLMISKFSKAAEIIITKRNIATLRSLKDSGVGVTDDNSVAVGKSEVIILAVKPFQLTEVLSGIKKELTGKKILISVVTGVTINDMESIIGKKIALFRAMPNTAIAIQESMTCICNKEAAGADIKYVNDLFSKLGKVVTIDEKLMEASTILGACGDAATASLIAAQTVKGAAELLLKKGTHPEQEIDKVTTPKGCTIAGLNEMEHQGFSSSLIKGIVASYKKIAKD